MSAHIVSKCHTPSYYWTNGLPDDDPCGYRWYPAAMGREPRVVEGCMKAVTALGRYPRSDGR